MTLRGPLAHCRSTGLIALGFAQLAACTARPDGESIPSQSTPPAKPTPPITETSVRPRSEPRPSSELVAARDTEASLTAATSPGGASSLTGSPAEGAGLDLSTGAVVFSGLEADQLATIRIIPETGAALVPAADGTFQGVDGLWLRGERRWFKIPGGTRVVVSANSKDHTATPAAAASATPAGTQRRVIAGDLVFEITSSPASAAYQRLKGPAAMAGWQVDEGSSAHPTDYPF